MTLADFPYTATVGAYELGFKGGDMSLSSTRAHHVEARLTLSIPGHWDSGDWTPDPDVLEALDPRETPRVTITADGYSFDLGVRDWDIDYATGEVELTLASDEALLEDYKPLADDIGARAHESSARAVTNYVLGIVIPGASLEASPSVDADVTRYWAATNVMPNPSVVGSLGTYYAPRDGASAADYSTAVGGALGTTSAVRWTASGTGISQLSARQHTATAGETYVASVYVRSPNSRSMRIRLFWRDSEGELIRQVTSTPVTAANNWSTRLSMIATAPKGTAKVGFVVERVSGTNNEWHYADMFSLVEDDELTDYFDGSTTPTGYASEWTDTAHQSPSDRTPTPVDRDKESLTWRSGQSALDFLAPILQAAGLRLVCDGDRKWTLRDETYEEPGTANVRHGVNMIEGSERISRDSGTWFDACIVRYHYLDRTGAQREKVDAYSLTLPYTRAVEREINSSYPGRGRAEYAVRRAQTRGREVSATAVALWSTRPEQTASITVPSGFTLVGSIEEVRFDLGPGDSRDRMTITIQAQDIPPGAVDLLVGTVNSLTGTVNSL